MVLARIQRVFSPSLLFFRFQALRGTQGGEGAGR